MKISDIITVKNIVLLDDAVTKRQLIQELASKAAKVLGIDERTLFDIVWERENLGSTGFGNGAALPHGRIPGLEKLGGIFARLSNPVDFDAADRQPVDLVFLLLSPENSGADHLSALAQISRIIKDENCRNQLRQAKNEEEVYKILIA